MTAPRIHGLEEVTRRLRRLPDKVAGRELEEATVVAATIVRDDAVRRLEPHRRTGRGERSMTVKPLRRNNRREAVVLVGARREGFYLYFLERGTRRQAARPFLLPALDSRAGEVLRVLTDELWRRMR